MDGRVKRLLEAQRNRLVRRLGRIQEDLRTAHDDDWAERATEVENDPVLERLDSSGRSELAAIRAALARLDEGIYGVCSKCGKPIDKRRLQAMPTATSCVVCSTSVPNHGATKATAGADASVTAWRRMRAVGAAAIKGAKARSETAGHKTATTNTVSAAKKAWATRRSPVYRARHTAHESEIVFSRWANQHGWRVVFLNGPSGNPRTGIVDAVMLRVRPRSKDQIDIRLVQLKSGCGGLTGLEVDRLCRAVEHTHVEAFGALCNGAAVFPVPLSRTVVMSSKKARPHPQLRQRKRGA